MNTIEKSKLKEILINVFEIIEINEQQKELFISVTKDTILKQINEETKEIIIIVDSLFYMTIIENSFRGALTKAFNNVLNSNYNVVLTLKEDYNKQQEKLKETKTKKNIVEKKHLEIDYSTNSLKEKLTFKTYVVSNINQMIYSAALSVSLKPGGPWNPLFIYGGSGLGKTHLLHAIGNKTIENHPNFNVKYIQAKDFGELVHQAIKSKNASDEIEYIKENYSKYDMLLVDDIQFIQTWTKAKEIFFHIFNNFIENDKQVIITSDTYPQELDNFEQRFITRFEKGLTIGILPPDFEGAKKIIKMKMKLIHDFDLNFIDEECIEYLAKNFSTNIRELEGSINRVIFWTINTNVNHITMEVMNSIFKDNKNKISTLTFDNVVNAVVDYYNISKEEVLGKSRHKNILLARQITIYLSRTLLNFSLKEISKKIDRNHSTIISSIKKIEQRKEIDKNLNIAISKIKANILK